MDVAVATVELDEAELAILASALAAELGLGDCIALHGDLGAGKTTFARAFIRATLGDADAEVQSPTFPIEQLYESPRGLVAHYDLYRLGGPDDLEGIGFLETQPRAVVLVEWPARAGDLLPHDRLDLTLSPGSRPTTRYVRMTASGACGERVARALKQLDDEICTIQLPADPRPA